MSIQYQVNIRWVWQILIFYWEKQLLYIHVGESNIFVYLSKITPDLGTALSFCHVQRSHQPSSQHVSLRVLLMCLSDFASGGAVFAFLFFDEIETSWQLLNSFVVLIPPCKYRFDTNVNIGIDIIDIWINPPSHPPSPTIKVNSIRSLTKPLVVLYSNHRNPNVLYLSSQTQPDQW